MLMEHLHDVEAMEAGHDPIGEHHVDGRIRALRPAEVRPPASSACTTRQALGSSIRWMSRRIGASSSMTSTVVRENTFPPLNRLSRPSFSVFYRCQELQ